MTHAPMIISGKRKTAIAKSTIKKGSGVITLNGKPIGCLSVLQRLEISEPLIIAHNILKELKFDVALNVKGGGSACQIEAARLALAKSIVQFTQNEEVRLAFLRYDRNMLIADTRRKEACKPGDSKARANRQTSFR